MAALTLADIADEDDNNAFAAFRELVGPALWAVIVRDVHRAKPGTCACRPDRPPMFDAAHPIPGPLCQRCMDQWTPRLMDGFGRIRAALMGDVPTIAGGSNAGQEVRELIVVRDHLVTPEAEWQEAAVHGAMLCHPAFPGGISPEPPGWLRAVWAQLVHFPTAGRIVPTVRRESAAERGLPTRPEVAISTAEWAAPLRADPVGQNILIHFLLGLRDEITDPFSLPKMQLRFGLSERETDERLRRSLALLRRCNPDFYARAVAGPLAGRPGGVPDETGPDECIGDHVPSVEDSCAAEADADTARKAIIAELLPPVRPSDDGRVRDTHPDTHGDTHPDTHGDGYGRRENPGPRPKAVPSRTAPKSQPKTHPKSGRPGTWPKSRPDARMPGAGPGAAPPAPGSDAIREPGATREPGAAREAGVIREPVLNAVTVRLLKVIVDAAYGKKADVVAAFRRHLRLGEEEAEAEVGRFTRLVAGAGVCWVDVLLRGIDGYGVA
ncbi:hypothetical protein [Frankia sp. CiP1_Cm_nod1]|uniref:hypothetical protein n=1 Tax=Frankia sp. CiP1_Cm_nod1 TaxID=2897160 RepID=UPI00202519D1